MTRDECLASFLVAHYLSFYFFFYHLQFFQKVINLLLLFFDDSLLLLYSFYKWHDKFRIAQAIKIIYGFWFVNTAEFKTHFPRSFFNILGYKTSLPHRFSF